MAALWEPSYPTTGTNIVDIPLIHNHMWEAFEETFTHEHYTFSDTLTASGVTVHASGKHRSGLTAALCAAASAEMTDLGTPISGVMALDLQNSTLMLSWDGAFRSLSLSGASDGNYVKRTAAMVNASADKLFQYASTDTPQWELIPFHTEIYDYASRWSVTSYRLTPCASGLYFISLNTTLSGQAGQRIELRIRYDYWVSSTLTSADIATYIIMCKGASANSFQGDTLWMCPSGSENTVAGSSCTLWLEGKILDQQCDWTTAVSAVWASGIAASATGNTKTTLQVIRIH